MDDPRDPSPVLAASPGPILGEWRIGRVTGARPGGVAFRLERGTDGAALEVIVGPKGSQALVQTSVGAVSYRRFSGIDDAEAAETARRFGGLLETGAVPLPVLFPHLAIAREPDDGERRGFAALAGARLRALPPSGDEEEAPPGRLHFDPPGIAEFLAPEVTPDGDPVAGHVLRSIHLTSMGRRSPLDFSNYVLEFVSVATGGTVRLRLSAGGHDEGFGRAGDLLALGVLGSTGGSPDELPADVVSLASWVLALLRWKLGRGGEVFVPARAEELRSIDFPRGRTTQAVPAPSGPPSPGAAAVQLQRPPVLNLAVDSDCGQACVFCSVKSYVPPADGGEAELENLRMQLRWGREAGIEEVRLNGIDPLAFSRVLDVVESVREVGFPRLTVFSPCRRFADERFRREFFRRAPRRVDVSVPLYGVTAAAHDAATGAPGAHAEVLRAIEGLLESLPATQVHLTTVVVRENLHELAALARFAHGRGMGHHVKMPYPMRQTARDPYSGSVVRESAVVDAFLAQVAEWKDGKQDSALGVLASFGHPCLHFRAEQRTGLPVFGVNASAVRPSLPGTEYRKTDAFVHDSGGEEGGEEAFVVSTVRCPHESACALAPVCPAEHYAVYAQLFGLQEFAPVCPAELYRAVPRFTGSAGG